MSAERERHAVPLPDLPGIDTPPAPQTFPVTEDRLNRPAGALTLDDGRQVSHPVVRHQIFPVPVAVSDHDQPDLAILRGENLQRRCAHPPTARTTPAWSAARVRTACFRPRQTTVVLGSIFPCQVSPSRASRLVNQPAVEWVSKTMNCTGRRANTTACTSCSADSSLVR